MSDHVFLYYDYHLYLFLLFVLMDFGIAPASNIILVFILCYNANLVKLLKYTKSDIHDVKVNWSFFSMIIALNPS
jgi:hypothetical protein